MHSDGPGKINILFVTRSPQRWVSFEWLCQHLDREKFRVSFAVLDDGDSQLIPYLRATGVPVHAIDYTADEASGARKLLRIFRAARDIARCCRAHDIHIVHAHFYSACLAALAGAFLAGVKVRLHTRHYADPHAMPHVPWKRALNTYFINALSTKIVAPSLEVKRYLVASEGVAEAKVPLIHHGFDLGQYSDVAEQDVLAMRTKYGLEHRGPIIGVISRYTAVKGIQYVIPAFKRLLDHYPTARLVLVSADGDYADSIRAQLRTLPRQSYVEIPFEDEIFALFRTFDVFIHVPIAPELEAFGQVYVEALAAGIPSVFTRTGIACEVMEHKVHAWIVEHRNSEAIFAGLCALLENAALRQTLVANGRRHARENFGLEKMIGALERLYEALRKL